MHGYIQDENYYSIHAAGLTEVFVIMHVCIYMYIHGMAKLNLTLFYQVEPTFSYSYSYASSRQDSEQTGKLVTQLHLVL